MPRAQVKVRGMTLLPPSNPLEYRWDMFARAVCERREETEMNNGNIVSFDVNTVEYVLCLCVSSEHILSS